MATTPTAENFEELSAEAAGLYAVRVIRIEQAASLLMAAETGDKELMQLALMCGDVLCSPRQLCLLCETVTPRNPAVIIFVRAYRDDAKRAVAFTLCDHHSLLSDNEITSVANEKIIGGRKIDLTLVSENAGHA